MDAGEGLNIGSRVIIVITNKDLATPEQKACNGQRGIIVAKNWSSYDVKLRESGTVVEIEPWDLGRDLIDYDPGQA